GGTGPAPAFGVRAVSQVTTQADLSVTKDGPNRAVAGSNLVFTVTVRNQGPSVATGVTLSDPTPPGLIFVSNSGDCTTAFPCALGNLAPGATRTITTTLSVPSGYVSPDPIVNQASVTSATPDPAPGNNSAESSVGLNAPVANLTIAKSNGATSVVPGRTTTYTITVGNTGPSDVAGVQVTDPQSPVLSGFTWTCSATGGASCAAASGAGALTTTVNLPAGTSATFLLTATVAAQARGEVTNTAQADSPAGVGGNSHVSGSDTDQLTPLADMSVTKAGPTNAVPGNDVVYTLVVHNAGPSSPVSDSPPHRHRSDASPTHPHLDDSRLTDAISVRLRHAAPRRQPHHRRDLRGPPGLHVAQPDPEHREHRRRDAGPEPEQPQHDL